jgi:hypothetical protein
VAAYGTGTRREAALKADAGEEGEHAMDATMEIRR